MPEEQWKEYKNTGYFFSNYGRVFSQKTKKFLKTTANTNSSGYERVVISFDGKKERIFIHITVVYLFGDCKGKKLPKKSLKLLGKSIDHLNRDKTNNSVFNLEIVSHSENVSRYFKSREIQSTCAEELALIF